MLGERRFDDLRVLSGLWTASDVLHQPSAQARTWLTAQAAAASLMSQIIAPPSSSPAHSPDARAGLFAQRLSCPTRPKAVFDWPGQSELGACKAALAGRESRVGALAELDGVTNQAPPPGRAAETEAMS